MTNKKYLPSDYKNKNSKITKLLLKKIKKNKKNWLNSYYYLTNNKYKNLDKIRIEKENSDVVEEYYFNLLAKEQKWYTYYAMDWITQINFFHHYLNHQVIYVTGATGTGKSTQVPKLLLYALKMCDYKFNAKMIATQPRIPPTVNNIEQISMEMGVPIHQKSKTINEKINTNNYYLQYKHQYNQHTKINIDHLVFKMVTDGTLLEELILNPIMKEQIFSKTKEDYTYSHNNKYDILIVDEAHEHNINMDIILTLARNSCIYNNSIKLVLSSPCRTRKSSSFEIFANLFQGQINWQSSQP